MVERDVRVEDALGVVSAVEVEVVVVVVVVAVVEVVVLASKTSQLSVVRSSLSRPPVTLMALQTKRSTETFSITPTHPARAAHRLWQVQRKWSSDTFSGRPTVWKSRKATEKPFLKRLPPAVDEFDTLLTSGTMQDAGAETVDMPVPKGRVGVDWPAQTASTAHSSSSKGATAMREK
jgi:hypothetical protein